MIKDTSLEAYSVLTKSGAKKSQTERVFDFIVNNPNCSRAEISKYLNITINAVCGRCNELLKNNSVHVSGKKIGSNGIKVETLSIL